MDLNGFTVLPGLIDLHVHFGGNTEIADMRKTVLAGGDELVFGGREFTDDYQRARETALQWGVTTERSVGDYLDDIVWLREQIKNGTIQGPNVYLSGPSFQQLGGHPNMTVWGGDSVALQQAGRTPETPDEARKMVAVLVNQGVDVIKVIINRKNFLQPDKPFKPLPWNIVAAIVDEASASGLRVIAHTENVEDAEKAVDLGVNELTHLFFEDSQADLNVYTGIFNKMIDKNVVLTPAMITSSVHGSGHKDSVSGRPRFGSNVFGMAYDMGVMLGAGTDAGAPGVPHGLSLHQELEMLVNEQNISPLEAITLATGNNAKILGADDFLGTIKVGKIADIVIVKGSPVENIDNTKNIALVIKSGKVVVCNEQYFQ
jgi:enamidase